MGKQVYVHQILHHVHDDLRFFVAGVPTKKAADILGMEAKDVIEARRYLVGSQRALSKKWLPSVGMWRCLAAHEIAERLGISEASVEEYRGARQATLDELVETQAQLARDVYEFRHYTVQDVADVLGLLRLEVALYYSRFILLAGKRDVAPQDLLTLPLGQLDELWREDDLKVEMPDGFYSRIRHDHVPPPPGLNFRHP